MKLNDAVKAWLTDLMVREVSPVGRPANRRQWLVLKGETMTEAEAAEALDTIDKIQKAGLGDAIEHLAADDPDVTAAVLKKANLGDAEAARVKAALRILGPDLTAKLPEFLSTEKKAPDMTDEEKAAAKKAEAEKAEADKLAKAERGTVLKAFAKFLGLEKKTDDDLSDLPDEVSAVIKAERDASAEREKVLKAQIDKADEAATKSAERVTALEANNRRTTFIEKSADLKVLPGVKADDFAAVLDEIDAKCDPKTAEALAGVLKAAASVIEKGDTFKQLSGRGVPPAGSALEEVERKAESLVEKDAEKKLTKAAAIERVVRDDPELYERYTAEQRDLKR